MTAYDWLLIFFGAGLAISFVFQGLLRALFSLFALWSATLAAAALYQETAFRLQSVTGPNESLAYGLVFDALLMIFLIAGYVLTRLAFPVTKLPKLGFLDNTLGFVVGVVIALLLVALLLNSMGVMVMERWETNDRGWASLRASYTASGIRAITSRALSIYAWAFVPFFRGLPPVLLPR
ncbi:MAG: CvpA family protein [Anaerolineae bacterium]|nr:CvpA family protein [Anaerolineae bacterium]